MKPATYAAALLLICGMLALAALVFAADTLEWQLPGGLPLGNALAAFVLSSVAAAAVALSSSGTVPRRVSVFALVLALAWLPVSIVLAGNLALNFSGARGDAWWMVSLAVAVSVVVSLLSALITRVVSKAKRFPIVTSYVEI